MSTTQAWAHRIGVSQHDHLRPCCQCGVGAAELIIADFTLGAAAAAGTVRPFFHTSGAAAVALTVRARAETTWAASTDSPVSLVSVRLWPPKLFLLRPLARSLLQRLRRGELDGVASSLLERGLSRTVVR
jgi:hypothetical protein